MRIFFGVAIAIVIVASPLWLADRAAATLPIPVLVVGCIANNQMVSGTRTYRVSKNSIGEAEIFNLSEYEGATVEIDGVHSLANGLIPTKVTRVAATCDPKLHRDIVLCNPCMTMPKEMPKIPTKPLLPGISFPSDASRLP